jgi:hypothetical protein
MGLISIARFLQRFDSTAPGLRLAGARARFASAQLSLAIARMRFASAQVRFASAQLSLAFAWMRFASAREIEACAGVRLACACKFET